MKIEHVIVPTDYSEASVNAMRFGAAIAREKGAKISLLHVYERPYMSTAYNGGISATIDSKWSEEIRQQAIHDLKELAKDEALKGLDPKAILVADKAPWEFHEFTVACLAPIPSVLFATRRIRSCLYRKSPSLKRSTASCSQRTSRANTTRR